MFVQRYNRHLAGKTGAVTRKQRAADRAQIKLPEFESEKNSQKQKPTRINREYISSPEYKAKFQSITDDKEVNDLIYKKSRDMLEHRSGTYLEDMYLIDTDTKQVVGAQTHSQIAQEVVYNKSLNDAIKNHPPQTLISIHNHPESKPPSGSDLSSNGSRQYKLGVVVCHDGTIYSYKAGAKPFTSFLFDNTVDKFVKMGYNEMEAYERALNRPLRKLILGFKINDSTDQIQSQTVTHSAVAIGIFHNFKNLDLSIDVFNKNAFM